MSIVNIYNNKQEIIEKKNYELFDIKKIKVELIHKVVVWQRAKKRQASASTKTVSELAGSTRKIYRQKGTGSARHGSIKRNLFRGGAVTFGPTNMRTYVTKINKKQKSIALLHSLALKLSDSSLRIYEKFSLSSTKTKDYTNNYRGLVNSPVLFVDNNFQQNFSLAIRNLPLINKLDVLGVNVDSVISSPMICFSKEAMDIMIERLSNE